MASMPLRSGARVTRVRPSFREVMMAMSSSSIGRMKAGLCTPLRSGLMKGPSRWMPRTPGMPASSAARMASTASAMRLAGIGDEGRQEPGGAIGAVGLRDGPDALDGAHVVVENAAAAIDLHVDEAGSEQALDRAAFDTRAEILLLRARPRMRPFSMTTARPSSMCDPSKIRAPVRAMVIRGSPSPCAGAEDCPDCVRAPRAMAFTRG